MLKETPGQLHNRMASWVIPLVILGLLCIAGIPEHAHAQAQAGGQPNQETRLDWFKVIISFLKFFLTLITVVIGGLWAYTKFVLERVLLPPVEFTIDCNVLGKQCGKKILEILLNLKNVGISTLIADKIEVRLRYLKANEEVANFLDVTDKKFFGRINFPHSQSKEILASFKITEQSLESLKSENVPGDVLQKLQSLKNKEVTGEEKFLDMLKKTIGDEQTVSFKSLILKHAEILDNKPCSPSSIRILPDRRTFVQAGVNQVYTLVTAVPECTTFVLIWAQFQYVTRPSKLQKVILRFSRRLRLIQHTLEKVKEPHTVERAFNVH